MLIYPTKTLSAFSLLGFGGRGGLDSVEKDLWSLAWTDIVKAPPYEMVSKIDLWVQMWRALTLSSTERNTSIISVMFRKNQLSSIIVHKPLEKWTFMFLASQMQNKQEKKSWRWKLNPYNWATGSSPSPTPINTGSRVKGFNSPSPSLPICLISELCPVSSVTRVFWPPEFVFTFLLLSIRSNYLKDAIWMLSRYGYRWHHSILLLYYLGRSKRKIWQLLIK